jgi:hypothetical protein
VVGTTKEDFVVLIDTGSVVTGIPEKDCVKLGLKVAGTAGLRTAHGDDIFPIFDGMIEIDGRQFNCQIAGLYIDEYILGLDILSYYRLNIDWLSNPKNARAEY